MRPRILNTVWEHISRCFAHLRVAPCDLFLRLHCGRSRFGQSQDGGWKCLQRTWQHWIKYTYMYIHNFEYVSQSHAYHLHVHVHVCMYMYVVTPIAWLTDRWAWRTWSSTCCIPRSRRHHRHRHDRDRDYRDCRQWRAMTSSAAHTTVTALATGASSLFTQLRLMFKQML